MTKRLILVPAFAAIMALSLAAAATLTVNGGTIQEGTDTDLTCTDAVTVAGWGYESDTSEVSFVRFSELPAECVGADLFVTVLGSGGATLTTGSATIGAGETTVHFDDPVDAEDIGRLQVAIEGGEAS